jgi:hypothetical protein
MIDDLGKQIDRRIVTKTTLLDIAMNSTHDVQEFKEIYQKYCAILRNYDLWEKPFVEVSDESDIHTSDDKEGCEIYEEKGKWGVKETMYHCALPAEYDKIECVDETTSLFLISRDEHIGLVYLLDKVEVWLEPVYDNIKVFNNLHIIVSLNNLKGYWYKGQLSDICFEEIYLPKYAGWVKVKLGGAWGWLDGNLTFTTEQSEAHEYVTPELFEHKGKHQIATRERLDEASRLDLLVNESDVGTKGQALEKLKETALPLIENDKIEIYQDNEKYGIKDFLGFIIVKAEYNEIIFTEQKYSVTAFGKTETGWGIICEYGEPLKDQLYLFDEVPIQSIYSNWYKVKINGKYGIYDSDSGKIILEANYDEIESRSDFECVITKKDGKKGFFDYKFCVPPIYENVVFGRGLAFVRFQKDNRLGYIDKNLNWTEDIGRARILAKNPMFNFK